MKKFNILFGVLTVITVMAFALISCNKEIPIESPSQALSPEQRIAQLNAATHFPRPSSGEIREKHFWVGFAVADLLGAWEGGKLSAEFSGGNPMATSLGIVGGAAIGSGYYYWQNGYPTNPIDTIPTDLKYPTASFAKSYGDSVEWLGYMHNEYILSMFRKGQVMAETIEGMNEQWGSTLANSMTHDMGMDPSFYLSIWNDPNYMAHLCKDLPAKYSEAVDTLASFAPDPHAVRPWVDSLYSHIYNLDDADLHYASDYAEAYSEMVKKDNSLNPEDTNYLLSGFSILRYSAALWSANE